MTEEKQELDDRKEELYLKSCLEGVMSTVSGRHVMYWLLNSYGVFKSSFDVTAPDPLLISFREGFRNAGLLLYTRLNDEFPDYYNKMLVEQRLKENKDE